MLAKGNVNLAFNWFKWKLAHSHWRQTAKALWSKDHCTGFSFHWLASTLVIAFFNWLLSLSPHLWQWWIRATLMTIIISDSRRKGWAKWASALLIWTQATLSLCSWKDSHCSSLAYPLIVGKDDHHSHHSHFYFLHLHHRLGPCLHMLGGIFSGALFCWSWHCT